MNREIIRKYIQNCSQKAVKKMENTEIQYSDNIIQHRVINKW